MVNENLHFTFSRKTSFIFILCILPIIVFDSTVVKFIAYSNIELSSSSNVSIFGFLSVAIMLVSAITISFVRKNKASDKYYTSISLRFAFYTILVVQVLFSLILVSINMQMVFLHSYDINYLRAGTYLGHLTALVFLLFLSLKFINWGRSKRNYVIILFATAFLLLSTTIVVSLLYLQIQFNLSFGLNTKPSSIHSVVITHPMPRGIGLLNTSFDFLSLLSFLTIWIATIVLLSQYRFRMGRIKYYTLMTIPLIYYIFPFEAYFGNVFADFKLSSPVLFGIIYVLIFSATKQVGAFMFSLSFWTASALIVEEHARKSLLLCALGMVILFGSLEIDTLQYAVYPPYGFITEALLPLGSYLFFIGISMSAKHVARDAALRKQFHKRAETRLDLLKTIGVVEMEKELINRYKYLDEISTKVDMPEDYGHNDEDVKEILRDVLNELNSKLKNKDNNENK